MEKIKNNIVFRVVLVLSEIFVFGCAVVSLLMGVHAIGGWLH